MIVIIEIYLLVACFLRILQIDARKRAISLLNECYCEYYTSVSFAWTPLPVMFYHFSRHQTTSNARTKVYTLLYTYLDSPPRHWISHTEQLEDEKGKKKRTKHRNINEHDVCMRYVSRVRLCRRACRSIHSKCDCCQACAIRSIDARSSGWGMPTKSRYVTDCLSRWLPLSLTFLISMHSPRRVRGRVVLLIIFELLSDVCLLSL